PDRIAGVAAEDVGVVAVRVGDRIGFGGHVADPGGDGQLRDGADVPGVRVVRVWVVVAVLVLAAGLPRSGLAEEVPVECAGAGAAVDLGADPLEVAGDAGVERLGL